MSDWDAGEFGHMDFEGICHSISIILNAIARLSTNLDPQNYDLLNMGPREHVVGEVHYGDWGEEEEEMELGLQTPVKIVCHCRSFAVSLLFIF